jgi:DNA-binding MarR family transcriptional regulator
MADINSGRSEVCDAPKARGGSGAGPDPSLLELVELLFFAYRDFTGEADVVLADYDFGRAHHRVLHFVNQRPGLRVADLLDILRITKQSLARVLKQLVDRGFITQMAGDTDRRERRLYVTEQGRALAEALVRLQTARIARALAAAGPMSEEVARAFLVGMISETSTSESVLQRGNGSAG